LSKKPPKPANPIFMATQQTVPQWFAIRVKSHREKAVAQAAHQKGFEYFLPLFCSRHQWSDRLQSVESPLFPGYVFCRLVPENRLAVLTIPGVVDFVAVGKIPVHIHDAEIAAIQLAVQSKLAAEPYAYLEDGNRIRLAGGPLAGMDGFLIESDTRQQVVIGVSALRRSVAIGIEPHWLKAMEIAYERGR
jgi:transcription antitermination factor NusG